MENQIAPVEPTPAETSIGVATMTLALIDGVQIAVATTTSGFRTAGIGIPKLDLPGGRELAIQRARYLAVDRLKTFKTKLAPAAE